MKKSFFTLVFFYTCFITINATNIVSGSWSEQGRKRTQQDRHMSEIFESEQDLIHCFGVFDGHGDYKTGHLVAEYAKNNLLGQLVLATSELITQNNLEQLHKSITQTFTNFDANLKNSSPNFTFNNGTTATTVLIWQHHCLVANVGDSMAFLQRAEQAITITHNHRIDESFSEQFEKTETTYLEKKVSSEQFYQDYPFNRENLLKRTYCDVKLIAQHKDDKRDVYEAILSMYRAFGDSLFSPHVTAFPFVQSFDLTPQDQFIIIASDGLWDNMTGKAAAKFVLAYLQEHNIDIQTITPEQAQATAQALVQASINIDDYDNTTATIIFFI